MEGWNDGGQTELLLPATCGVWVLGCQAKRNGLLAKSGPRPIAAPSATPQFGGPVALAELGVRRANSDFEPGDLPLSHTQTA